MVPTAPLDLTWYPRGTGEVTWVFAAGYVGDSRFAATLSFTHDVKPQSMFGPFVQDNLLTVTYPAAFINPSVAFAQLLGRLRPVSGREIVLVGLSRGGQFLEEFYLWHRSLPADQQLPHLTLVLISTPPGLAQLRPPFRQLVGLTQRARLPLGLGRLARPLAGLFITPASRRRLKAQSHQEVLAGWKRSNASSGGLVANLRALALSSGFVPSWADNEHVYVVHLKASNDKVVDVPAALAATLDAYPGAVPLTLDVPEHGTPEADGPAYAELLGHVRSRLVSLLV